MANEFNYFCAGVRRCLQYSRYYCVSLHPALFILLFVILFTIFSRIFCAPLYLQIFNPSATMENFSQYWIFDWNQFLPNWRILLSNLLIIDFRCHLVYVLRYTRTARSRFIANVRVEILWYSRWRFVFKMVSFTLCALKFQCQSESNRC